MSFINSIVGALPRLFNVGVSQIALVYVSFSVGACFAVPLVKLIQNKFSLIQVFSCGLLILVIFFGVSSQTTNWYFFVLSRLIQGFCLTLSYSLSFTYAMTYSKNKANTINFISSICVVGLISGPLLSDLTYAYNWRYIYYLFILYIFLVLIFIWCLADAKILHSVLEASYFSSNEYLLIVMTMLAILCCSQNWSNQVLRNLSFASIIAFGGLLLRYYQANSTTTMLNRAIFNKFLLYSLLLNLFARFTLVGILPLLGLILATKSHRTISQISTYMMISAIFSLLAKLAFKLKIITNYPEISFYIFILSIFLFMLLDFFTPSNLLCLIIFASYGFCSSLAFNFVNLSFYLRQDSLLINDLSQVANLFQIFMYGFCIKVDFSLYDLVNTDFRYTKFDLSFELLILSSLAYISFLFYAKLARKNKLSKPLY